MSKLGRLCAVLAFATLLSLAPPSAAGEIAGKVILSGTSASDVVISIEGLKVENLPDSTVHVIDHHNLNFVPHVLVVRVGTTVQFKNSDGMPCRIYSISKAGLFVLSRHDGQAMTITFDRPGMIELRCADHSRIDAYIFIKENPYFALTDSKGQYKISNLPPGRYTLQAWYEGTVVKSRTINVVAKNLTIDFKASRPHPKSPAAQAPDNSSFAADALMGGRSSIFSEEIQ